MALGGKKTCKYYKACGNTENCSRCKAYEKGGKANVQIKGKKN